MANTTEQNSSGEKLHRKAIVTPTALDLSDVSVRIGRKTILHKVNLKVHTGELVGLIGPNGSGKTTLIKAAIGQHFVNSGSVSIAGYDVLTRRVDAVAQLGLAVDPEDLPEQLTGQQVVQLAASAKGLGDFESQLHELIDLFELRPYFMAEIGTYSKGTKQKIGILIALLGKPSLIILDESLSNLDPVSVYHMKRYLSELVHDGSVAVLLASHAIEVVEKISTSVAILLEGHIQAVLTRQEIEDYRQESGKDLEEMFIELISTSSGTAIRTGMTWEKSKEQHLNPSSK